MMKRLSLTILFCLLLSGCIFDPAFDMSSWEAYQTSLAAVRARLGDNDLRRLDIALKYLLAESMMKNGADIQMVSRLDAGESRLSPIVVFNLLKPKIDGKSAAVIIRNLALKLDAEISRSESKLQSPETADTPLEVTAPWYHWKRNGRNEQPAIEFSVFNGGTSAVSRIYFRLVLTTPNRSIPWVKQDYIENFKGGLEPREKRQIAFQPYGDWSDPQLKNLPDAQLKVDIVNYEDASGQRMISVDRESLELKRKIRAALA